MVVLCPYTIAHIDDALTYPKPKSEDSLSMVNPMHSLDLQNCRLRFGIINDLKSIEIIEKYCLLCFIPQTLDLQLYIAAFLGPCAGCCRAIDAAFSQIYFSSLSQRCILSHTHVHHFSSPCFEDGPQVFEVSGFHGWLVAPPPDLWCCLFHFSGFASFMSRCHCNFRYFLIVMSSPYPVRFQVLFSWVCLSDIDRPGQNGSFCIVQLYV